MLLITSFINTYFRNNRAICIDEIILNGYLLINVAFFGADSISDRENVHRPGKLIKPNLGQWGGGAKAPPPLNLPLPHVHVT